jgi:hypothetical protein
MESTSSPVPRRARSGCLIQVVGALIFGAIVALLVIAITAPWGFFMGGRFHIIPMWQGWGRLHSTASGGDYVLYVSFSPRNGTRGVPHVAGRGELCTPRGERYTLSVGGDFEKHLGTDLQGKRAYLYVHHASFIGGDTRPSLELRGKWNNPDLEMQDGGSISRSFEPDGSLYAGHSTSHLYDRETLQVTLHQGDKSGYEAACGVAQKR